MLVVDALRLKSRIFAFSLQEALDFAQSTKAKKVYLTHMDHEMGKQAETENGARTNVFLLMMGLKSLCITAKKQANYLLTMKKS